MRTMLKLVVMILAGGVVLDSGRSAQACHWCHRPLARVPYTCSICSRGYAYSTYSYGPPVSYYWVYPSSGTAGATAKPAPARTTTGAAKPRDQRPLVERVAQLEEDMGSIQNDLTRIRELLEGKRP
jgi:hypothetical protein